MNKKQILIIDINKNKINKNTLLNLKKNKIIVFRNIFNKEEIIRELNLFKKKKFKILKKSGDYFIGKKNFSRIDRKNKNSRVYPRFNIFHALFSWNKDKSFTKTINKALNFRDKLYGIKKYKEYIFKYKNIKYFNLIKVHHFPQRGHLGSHIDLSRKQERNFVVVLSKIGKDFSKGGFYIKSRNKVINIEDKLEIGDMICNDVNTYHGVQKIVCNKNQVGRYSLIISMRKVN